MAVEESTALAAGHDNTLCAGSIGYGRTPGTRDGAESTTTVVISSLSRLKRTRNPLAKPVDRLGGFQGPNPSQSNTQNPLRPLAQRTNTSLPSAASLLAGSPAQVLPPNPSTTFRQAGQATQATQATSFGNENSRPGQQPASFPHISMSQSTSQSFPRQMHDPISQATAAFGNSSPGKLFLASCVIERSI